MSLIGIDKIEKYKKNMSIKKPNLEILKISKFKGGFSFVIQQSRNMWGQYLKITNTK